MGERAAAPTLEQLLDAKQVEAALILKGDFTEKELELVRRAFDAGYKLGKEHRES